jgi:hypothetical protein
MKIKTQTIFIVLVIIFIASGTVFAGNRIISSSNDNIFTSITNSNGKRWEATSSNIQFAINDLDNKSGTVWLPGAKIFYITSTIIVWKNIMLDIGGSQIALPSGVNCNVIELKDGAGVCNGIINVAGHQASTNYLTTNSSFRIPSACIYLNATSCINSASIEQMYMDSTSDGYNNPGPSPPRWYSVNKSGSGYGIYLHAVNTSNKQYIRNVQVDKMYFRCFKISIYIHNERNLVGAENGAYIEHNTFQNIVSAYSSWAVNITRVVNSDKCTVNYNHFNQIQYEAGNGDMAEEYISHGIFWIGGVGNSITNIIPWDFTARHVCEPCAFHAFWFTDASCYCYLRFGAFPEGYIDNDGEHNTIWLVDPYWAAEHNLMIGKVYEYNP